MCHISWKNKLIFKIFAYNIEVYILIYEIMENIQKTVQFPLQTIKNSNNKNESFEEIVKNIKKNECIKEELDALLQRNINASNVLEWGKFVQDNKESLDEIEKNIGIFFSFIKELKNLATHQEQISVNLWKLKKAWSLWKGIYYVINDNNKNDIKNQISLSDFKANKINIVKDKIDERNTLVKYFSILKKECLSYFDAYENFVNERTNKIIQDIEYIKKNLSNANYEKERLSEINRKIFYIKKNYETIFKYISKIFIFKWNLYEETSKIKWIYESLEENNEKNTEILQTLGVNFQDPNNGFEIWRATLSYYTLNKLPDIQADIQELKRKLWDKRINKSWDKGTNKLSKYAEQIVNNLQSKEGINNNENTLLNNIKNKDNLLDKIDYIFDIVKEIVWNKNFSLYDILNCLNNKNQTYHEFITKKQDFSEIWLKQRLRFALTVLVDCDIYKPKKYIERCEKIKSDAEKELRIFEFDKYINITHKKKGWKKVTYLWYKTYTEKIYKQEHPKDNAKARGNLFVESSLYKDVLNTAKIVSSLVGSLNQMIKRYEDELLNHEKLQYFAILWENDKNEKILILVEKSEAKDFYEYIQGIENQDKVSEKIFLYDSITSKTIGKLFDQAYNSDHPFKYIKKEIFKNKNKWLKQKNTDNEGANIDKLKFKELNVDEVIKVLNSEKDITNYENWKEKYSKIYEKLKNIPKNIQEIFDIIDKYWINFVEKSIDFDQLKEKFPNIVISKFLNWETTKDWEKRDQKNHEKYLRKAIEDMKSQKDFKIRLNPELLISYVPQANDIEKKKKIKEKEWKVSEKTLENNHRYWRESIKVWFLTEFYNLHRKVEDKEKFRVIWLDRWEKKIATLCHLEYSNQQPSLLPIKYFEKVGKILEERTTYFIDCADFKVWRDEDNKKILIKISEDNNLNLRRLEYLIRLQKTLWLKENQGKLKDLLSKFEDINIKNIDEIRKEIEAVKTNETSFFSVDWLKTYIEKRWLMDDELKYKIAELLNNWKNFDSTEIPENEEEKIMWYHNKMNIETKNIPMRNNISAQIAWIVNFLYSNNKNEWYETYTILENLHNSNYWSSYTDDKVNGSKHINKDFVEATHNKLCQTGVYHKIEQAIIKKVQILEKWENYENLSLFNDNNTYIDKIEKELKNNSYAAKKTKQKDFYDKDVKISPMVLFNSIWFVDPWYTSNKCPKCWVWGKDKIKGHNTEDDIISCTVCEYNGKESVNNENKWNIKFKNEWNIEIYKIIRTGDENWSLQIGLRGIKNIIG